MLHPSKIAEKAGNLVVGLHDAGGEEGASHHHQHKSCLTQEKGSVRGEWRGEDENRPTFMAFLVQTVSEPPPYELVAHGAALALGRPAVHYNSAPDWAGGPATLARARCTVRHRTCHGRYSYSRSTVQYAYSTSVPTVPVTGRSTAGIRYLDNKRGGPRTYM